MKGSRQSEPPSPWGCPRTAGGRPRRCPACVATQVERQQRAGTHMHLAGSDAHACPLKTACTPSTIPTSSFKCTCRTVPLPRGGMLHVLRTTALCHADQAPPSCTNLSQSASASSMLCVVSTTARCRRARLITFHSSWREAGSRPAQGSNPQPISRSNGLTALHSACRRRGPDPQSTTGGRQAHPSALQSSSSGGSSSAKTQLANLWKAHPGTQRPGRPQARWPR